MGMGNRLNALVCVGALTAAGCGVGRADTGISMDTQPPATAPHRPVMEWMSPDTCIDLEGLAAVMRNPLGGDDIPEAAGKVSTHITRNPDGSQAPTWQNDQLRKALEAAREASSLAGDRSYDASQRRIQASGDLGGVIGYSCVGVKYTMTTTTIN